MEDSRTQPSPSRNLVHAENSTIITSQILARLPARSLMRFCTVSKLWFSILRSKYLADLFLAQSKTRPRLLFTFKDMDSGKRFFFSAPEDQTDNKSSTDDKSSTVIARHGITISDLDYITSAPVNGFVCYTRGSSVVLCNPTNGYYTQTFPEHLVHSLNFRFGWRKIQTNADPYAYVEGGICMDGSIYYGVGHTRIARFDVGSENIAFIQGPEDYNAISCYSTLTNYQGKLACISYGESHEMRMWILQDAEKQEWSNVMTCYVPCDKKTSLCTGEIHTNEVVMASRWLESSKPFYVYYMDMMRESIRRVQIDGLADNEFRRIHGIGKNALRISCYPGHVEHFVGCPSW
ncbi:PREDICTED: F-box protein At1g30790-like [Camelina sativa]|uniref:F-box protein At1g30790-like n=1 Tax=Camelina sativa TaxID=90675 RepID=A0ABM0WXZ2_CAMSA|nr:PREDICTED: F-box protein At1g30790-like [Camelina sativa]